MNRDEDLAREIRAHLELEAEERAADGASPAEARDAARRAFGNVTLIRENARAVWIPPLFDHAVQDFRYAARRFRRAPAFAIAAILILTAGIGLNLTFFQLLNVAALQPPAVAGIDSLVRFDRVNRRFSSNGIPYPATQHIRRNNTVLSAVLTSTSGDVVWGNDGNDRLRALYVSANWFRELGYDAAMGRTFSEAIEERADAAPVVIVSFDVWQTRLHGESVIGRQVRVNDRPATIAGVAPKGFPGLRLDDTQMWLPIEQIDYFNRGSTFKTDWASHSTQLYARLAAGVSPAAAREGLRPVTQELARLRPENFEADEAFIPYTGAQGFRSPRQAEKLRTTTVLISALTLVVLVLACANLNSLLLARAIGQLREFSVRAALGASRWRILRQQVVEAVLLVAAGSAGGLLASQWAARVIAAEIDLPPHVEFTPDWRTAAAACAIALVATVAVGLVPAWIVSRRDLIGSMRDGGQQTSRGLARTRFRLVLIASQVAGCCLLLIVAGATVRGLERLLTRQIGFEFAHVAVLDPALSRYGIHGEAARAFWNAVKERLAAAPDIERVALASVAPLAESSSRSTYNDAPRLSLTSVRVEPGFFPLLRIPLVAGRNFGLEDDGGRVVILSRRLAMEMYGGLDVLGKGFPRSSPEHTIVGIAADAPLVNVTATNVAEFYLPIGRDHYSGLVLLASARSGPERLLAPLRDAARDADERILPRTSLPAAWFEERLQGRRAASIAAGSTGLLALALACIGVFGLVASGVAMRTKEIGIRRALGAAGGTVVRLLLWQLTIPVCAGIVAGLLGGLAAGSVLAGEPFYLPRLDLVTTIASLAVFVVTAGAAALVPALRALRADPLHALRYE